MAPPGGPYQKSTKSPKGATAVKIARRGMGSRPTCTHTSMVKVYDAELRCLVCGRDSILGFMYECEQDKVSPRYFEKFKTQKKLLKGKQRRNSNDLEVLGFNQTVVKAAVAGHYSQGEIDVLKEQKLKVKQVIEAARAQEEAWKRSNKPDSPSVFNNFGKVSQSESSKSKDTKVSAKKEGPDTNKPVARPPAPTCNFRCCHNCRPFARDRTFVSVDAAYNEEVILPTEWQPLTMPVHDTSMVRNLGHLTEIYANERAIASDSSTVAVSPTSSMDDVYEESESEDLAMPRKTPSSQSLWQRLRSKRSAENLRDIVDDHAEGSKGFRESLKTALVDLVKRRSMLSPGSMRSKELEYKLKALSGEEVNLELWKELSDELLQQASAVPLPDETEFETLELLEGDEEGEGIGGVALTEHAVESHSPDVIISV